MDASKYEKSFDNRSAALVSRERRAPRATDECKSFEFNALEATSSMRTARGAQVSRAARERILLFSGRACSPLHAFSIQAPPSRMRCIEFHSMSHKCH
jgi:hypothetical protein